MKIALYIGLAGVLSLAPLAATAIDGESIGGGMMGMAAAPSGPTYYENLVGETNTAELTSTAGGLPTSLYLSDSSATVSYARKGGKRSATWTVKVRNLQRPHEKIDAVYQIVAVLPLPVTPAGLPAFSALQWGIEPRTGDEKKSSRLKYGGEKLVLKRNVVLEKALLPNLVGETSDRLPSLIGTGYEYTLWDTIVLYDPEYGETVQALADFSYTTASNVPAPDAADDRFKVYVLTWIPTLDPSIPPYAIRLDVRPD